MEENMGMSRDTTTDIDSDAPDGVLTGEQVQELASIQPPIIYEQEWDGKVKVAILEGLRTKQVRGAFFSIRKQGVRDGELTYNAGATLYACPLVPVLCIVEERLIDKMLIPPAAVAMGWAAIESLNPAPPINPLVDLLVEEYKEAASIDREFFLPNPEVTQVEGEGVVEQLIAAALEPVTDNIGTGFCQDSLTSGSNIDPGFTSPLTYGDPTTSPNYTGTITFSNTSGGQSMNGDKVEQVIAEPALIVGEAGEVRVSDNLNPQVYEGVTTGEVNNYSGPGTPGFVEVSTDPLPADPNTNDSLTTSTEVKAVPGKDATVSIDSMGLPVIETPEPDGLPM